MMRHRRMTCTALLGGFQAVPSNDFMTASEGWLTPCWCFGSLWVRVGSGVCSHPCLARRDQFDFLDFLSYRSNAACTECMYPEPARVRGGEGPGRFLARSAPHPIVCAVPSQRVELPGSVIMRLDASSCNKHKPPKLRFTIPISGTATPANSYSESSNMASSSTPATPLL